MNLTLDQLSHVATPKAPLVLKRAIEAQGQQSPIHVYCVPPETQWHVAAGLRRLAVMRDLGRATIKAIDITGTPEAEIAAFTLSENTARDRNPAAEADAVAIMLGQGWSVDDIASQTGTRKQVVHELIKIKDKLTPEAYEALEAGVLTRGGALKLAKLDQHEQQQIINGGEKVRLKDIDAAVRTRQQTLLSQLDQVSTPPLRLETDLAAQVERAALRCSGRRRTILNDAAQILRGLED